MVTDPKPVQESAPPAAALSDNDIWRCWDEIRAAWGDGGESVWTNGLPDGRHAAYQVFYRFVRSLGQPEAEPPPAPPTCDSCGVHWTMCTCKGGPIEYEAEAPRPPAASCPEGIKLDLPYDWMRRDQEEMDAPEPPRGAAAGEDVREDAQEVAAMWLDVADGAEGADQLESLTRLILGVRAQAREEGRKAGARETCEALASHYDDIAGRIGGDEPQRALGYTNAAKLARARALGTPEGE
jgi:hypothetical protein